MTSVRLSIISRSCSISISSSPMKSRMDTTPMTRPSRTTGRWRSPWSAIRRNASPTVMSWAAVTGHGVITSDSRV